MNPSPGSTASTAPPRVASIDALRGWVMFLMLAEALKLSSIGAAFPGNALAAFIAFHNSHVPWGGASLHDLIQSGFSLLVGAALPFSLAVRRARGQSFIRMLLHALQRAGILILLGIFLRSLDQKSTYFTFEDTLTQIGLGYPFLFLLGWLRPRRQAAALVLLLLADWLAFVLYPAAQPGLQSHFLPHANVVEAFDVWFLNLFPREQPFVVHPGSYATLNFIPTLGTMILGLLTGGLLRAPAPVRDKFKTMLIAAAGLVASGLLLDAAGLCPIVKRIWTPSFTLYSGGLVLFMLAALFAIMELRGWQRWAFPLLVIGANSIAAYLMSWTLEGFISSALLRHLGSAPFSAFGEALKPVMLGAAVLAVYWMVLYWMHRRKIFLRI